MNPGNKPNRRKHCRYALQVEVKYAITVKGQAPVNGSGRTLDMSAGGLLLQTTKDLPLGANIEISIPWFGIYHNEERVRLVASGQVVRTERDQSAIRLTGHEFRIYHRRSLQARAAQAVMSRHAAVAVL
jgi:c-di-GMP-binding flagellar brake protein YcgR